MTIHFDLARPTNSGRLSPISSNLRLSASDQNGMRLLEIIGHTAQCSFVEPACMSKLVERVNLEISLRKTRREDPRIRYELPRLVHLHTMFAKALNQHYGIVIWRE
jgi:hypothetical protein